MHDSTKKCVLVSVTSTNARDVVTTGVAPYERTQLPYWIADTISVSDVSTENATAYDVTIETLECFHNMQLLAFEFGDVNGQSVSVAGATVIRAPVISNSCPCSHSVVHVLSQCTRCMPL